MNKSEALISILNSNFFFKEFTFSKNKFKIDGKGSELELADNLVWIDDLLFINEIKERDLTCDSDPIKWFNNKILNKSVRQIKNTIKYLSIYNSISIENDKGHIINLSDAKNKNPYKIIIYSPSDSLPDSCRYQKFKKSQTVGLIHLFHIEDYVWICKFLITPYEIMDFLKFRESLYLNHETILKQLPEQYVLGHYFETKDVSKIEPRYIENLNKLVQDFDEFDISFIIKNFEDKIYTSNGISDYYTIIKELAKLNRSDLRAFKMRFNLSIENAREQKDVLPYRMISTNSHCGFIFVPLKWDDKENWQDAILFYSDTHKYEQKLSKVIGVIFYYNSDEKYFDINWHYSASEWLFDKQLEELIKNNYPFRPVSSKPAYMYKIKE